MKRLIARCPDITAVFAMSDVMAIGAIRALRDLEYRVPEDVSVIGFDGTALAEYYNPKLATIKQQYQTLATRSVEILFGQIELKGVRSMRSSRLNWRVERVFKKSGNTYR